MSNDKPDFALYKLEVLNYFFNKTESTTPLICFDDIEAVIEIMRKAYYREDL